MNWKRGLLRTWIVFSALWLALIIGIAVTDKSVPTIRHGCDELRDFVDDAGKPLPDQDVVIARCEALWRTERISLAEMALVPPVTLFCVGILLWWIANGFRTRSITKLNFDSRSPLNPGALWPQTPQNPGDPVPPPFRVMQ
jgi:hypothetical protein